MLQSAKLATGGQPSLARGRVSEDCHVPIGSQEWGNMQKKKGNKENTDHGTGEACGDKSFRNVSYFHSWD